METRISSSSMDNANKNKNVCHASAFIWYLYISGLGWQSVCFVGLFAVSSIFCMLTRGFMPNRFIVDGEKLVIDAYFRKTYINIEEILSAREVDRLDLGIMIRSFGVGWLFGDLGYFCFYCYRTCKSFWPGVLITVF